MESEPLKLSRIVRGKTTERVIENLSNQQYAILFDKLKSSGFEVYEQGHIHVRDVKEDHPKYDKFPLPVGFLGKSFALLVNTNEQFPEDYHAKDLFPPVDSQTQAVFAQGHEVTAIARTLFHAGISGQAKRAPAHPC